MKIGFDVAQTCSEKAGCAWHAESLAIALSKLLAKEELVLYHQFGDWLNNCTDNGLIIPNCYSPFLTLNIDQSEEIWNNIEEGTIAPPGEPDIIHSNSFMAPFTGNIPLVYTVHDLTFITHPDLTSSDNRRFCTDQFNKALKYADAFVFVSKSSLDIFNDYYPEWLNSNGKPHKVVNSGSRINEIDRLINVFGDDNAPWLFVGTIEPRKNIHKLLDAYQEYYCRSPIMRPLIFAGGKGWESSGIHERITYLSKRFPIRYLGYVPNSELFSLYSSAFCLLFSSITEGFGLPVLEAMSVGLPTISNQIASVKEFAGNSIYYANYEDPEEVSIRMLNLEDSHNNYNIIAENSISNAKKYSWDKAARSLIRFYREILGPREL